MMYLNHLKVQLNDLDHQLIGDYTNEKKAHKRFLSEKYFLSHKKSKVHSKETRNRKSEDKTTSNTAVKFLSVNLTNLTKKYTRKDENQPEAVNSHPINLQQLNIKAPTVRSYGDYIIIKMQREQNLTNPLQNTPIHSFCMNMDPLKEYSITKSRSGVSNKSLHRGSSNANISRNQTNNYQHQKDIMKKMIGGKSTPSWLESFSHKIVASNLIKPI